MRPPPRPPPPLPPLPPRGFAPWGFPHVPVPPHAPRTFTPWAVAPAFRPPLPPPRPPPRPPVDPDAAWLAQFRQRHLTAGRAATQQATDREPPLRRLSRMAALAKPKIQQLRSLANEALEIDARVRELESSVGGAEMREELTRLKAQQMDRLCGCERIREELEAMHASTLFVPPEQLPKLRAFMRRVEKKKEYRRKRRRRLRHEASIIRAAKAAAVATAEASVSVDSSTEQQPDNLTSQQTQDPAANQERRENDERRRAQRLLLLLDIKEQRLAGSESADAVETIRRQREQLLQLLKPRRHTRPKAKNPSRATESGSTSDTMAVARPNCTATSDVPKSTPPVKKTSSPDTLGFEALVTRRRAWDRFLVAPATPGASRIPPHFVVPPPPLPSSAWAIFAVPK